MTRLGWTALAVLAAILLGLLVVFLQGDCNREGSDDGSDDGMEPAGDTCKPGDNSCNAGPPMPTDPPTHDAFRRADPGEG